MHLTSPIRIVCIFLGAGQVPGRTYPCAGWLVRVNAVQCRFLRIWRARGYHREHFDKNVQHERPRAALTSPCKALRLSLPEGASVYPHRSMVSDARASPPAQVYKPSQGRRSLVFARNLDR